MSRVVQCCWLVAALYMGAACVDRAAAGTAESREFRPEQWAALLVAGDAAQPVFNNAVERMRAELMRAGVSWESIAILTSSPVATASQAATLANVLDRVGRLSPGQDGGCLLYLASHGKAASGFHLSRANEWLTPAELDRALDGPCASVPTVIVVSACFAGQFVAPLERENRIVLTAARSDRSSFGCSASATYANFDKCLFASMPGASSWQEIFGRAAECVEAQERNSVFVPSEPQAAFGSKASSISTPWSR